jgi:hypothetical protein
MSNVPRTPPRFVPTLTEVVHQPAAPPAGWADAGALQEQVVHRVMQRIDLSLERRLREAVALLVLEQTQALGPRLRDEIESAVRQSVSEAVAEELATRQPPRPEP